MSNNLFIVASLRNGSVNARAAKATEALVPAGTTVQYASIDLPLYNSDIDGDNAPDSVVAFRGALKAADAVFIFTPEYNFSAPGALKNAIDWASRPMFPQNSIVAKPMNVVACTPSTYNGIRAVVEIKRLWGTLGGVPVPSFDFVLHNAYNRFVDVDGVETFDEVATKEMKGQLQYLFNLVTSNAAAISQQNFDAFIASR